MASFSPKRSLAVHPGDRGRVAVLGDEVAGVLADRRVRVVVDLAAGDDRHPLVEQAGERADDPRLGLAALAEEDHVVAGEERVLELRHHRVLVAQDTLEQRLAGSDLGDGVAPDLLLHRHRGPAGGQELTQGRGQGAGLGRHANDPTPVREIASDGSVPWQRWIDGSRSGAHGPERRVARVPRRRRAPARRDRHRRRRSGVADGAGARPTGRPTQPSPARTGRCCTAPGSSIPGPEDGERLFVTFDGIFSQADVWLDGAYLGDPEGYFVPHSFDVTSLLRLGERARARRRGHLAAAARAARSGTSPASSRTGGCAGSWNPGGIWRPVHIDRTGPVRIDRLPRAVPRRERQARPPALRRRARRRRAAPGDDQHVRRRRCSSHERAPVARPRRATTSRWNLDVPDPRCGGRGRWATSRCTTSPSRWSCDGVEQRSAHGADRSARGRVRGLGLLGQRRAAAREGRHARRRRGSALGDATPGELRRDVELAREAGLDLLRVHRPHRPPRDLRGRRRAGDAAVAGLPAARHLRPHRSASRRSSRRARRSTCSGTTRRSCCGAATTVRRRARCSSSCRRGTRRSSTAG